MYPHTRLVDDDVSPYEFQQLMPADDLSGTVDKGNQQIKGARADPHRLAVLQEQPLRAVQSKASKRHGRTDPVRTGFAVRRYRRNLHPGHRMTCHRFRSCTTIQVDEGAGGAAGVSSENLMQIAKI
ncbi:hypothetical protein J2W42_002986 [Rhizobium tibeticum]|uniref:hypothetical protein n=1 Tax=Rhizobium tibeticum TaxID=501024 RepID=UPI00278A7018|nr:hypothetical protein [Rhizobium tibeticum]MDP9810125.1 hypothetical protein [Rhizobium tibeticum]